MAWAVGITFYGGVALYVAAAATALAHTLGSAPEVLKVARRLTGAGAIAFAANLGLRWYLWGALPLTNTTDSLDLLTVLTTLVMLLALRQTGALVLVPFYAPPLAAIALLNAAVAHTNLYEAPRALPSVPLGVHVGLAFLAYALFFAASATSVAYVCQARTLKRRPDEALSRPFPPLEQLDRTLYRLVACGYPLFVITLLLGLTWVYLDRDLLSAHWWIAPKVLLSVVMAFFYAVTFHARQFGRLRGPKLAYVVVVGFSLLLAAYLVLAILHLRTYNFWGKSV